MPLFEFECKKCKKRFEEIVFGGKSPACPKCGSKSVSKLLSTFSFHGAGISQAQDKSCGSCSSDRSKCSTCH